MIVHVVVVVDDDDDDSDYYDFLLVNVRRYLEIIINGGWTDGPP